MFFEGAISADSHIVEPPHCFVEVRRSGWHPKYRLADQERDGLAAEILYASIGMVLCTHPDIEFKAACMAAYNRWLETYCAEVPQPLFGLAMTPVRSVDEAIADFRCAKAMGFVGLTMAGNPAHQDYIRITTRYGNAPANSTCRCAFTS